jgi:hypothetical protein
MANVMPVTGEDNRVLTIVVFDPVPSDPQVGDVVQPTLELTTYEETVDTTLGEEDCERGITPNHTLKDRIDDTSDSDPQPLPVLSDIEVRVTSDCDVGDEDLLVALVDRETWGRRVGVSQPRSGVDIIPIHSTNVCDLTKEGTSGSRDEIIRGDLDEHTLDDEMTCGESQLRTVREVALTTKVKRRCVTDSGDVRDQQWGTKDVKEWLPNKVGITEETTIALDTEVVKAV